MVEHPVRFVAANSTLSEEAILRREPQRHNHAAPSAAEAASLFLSAPTSISDEKQTTVRYNVSVDRTAGDAMK
jgi:hypothetical protein